MNFSLIICTYQRPDAITNLLNSVINQSVYPNQIIVVDGSEGIETQNLSLEKTFKSLEYFKVEDDVRGLTRQRNYGISRLNEEAEVVCFLDDDVILETKYFEAVIKTFRDRSDVVGIGGVATNENLWKPSKRTESTDKIYVLDGFERNESQRFYLRNKLGLQSPDLPGIMPSFSHGRTYGYPLTGKVYEVDLLIGMAMSFRRSVIDSEKFSLYFDGYGLYEDADYSLRALKYGKNVICTSAKLQHYHDPAGRPNSFKYGKMVLRNGWYVWRIKFPKPNLKSRLKWNATAFLLTLIRFGNALTTPSKKEAFLEASGRVVGWLSLFFNKPRS